LTRTKGWY